MKISKLKYLVKNLLLVLLVIGCLSSISCSKNSVSQGYSEVSNNVWKASAKKSFDFEMKDTTLLYDIFLQVRINEDYQYSNLWVGMNLRNPEGKLTSREFPVILSDEQGELLGSGIKGIYDNQFKIQSKVKFSKIGKYSVQIEQIMRDTALAGMMDIGFKVKIADQ